MKIFSRIAVILLTSALPAFAGITVNSPSAGNTVNSPFALSTSAAVCSSQEVAAMGYSLDNSSDTTIVYGQSIETAVASATGNHVLHVKAWGNHGASCVSDILVNVADEPIVKLPSNAVGVSAIQNLGDWRASFDTATGSGSSSGSMHMVNSPARSGQAREFSTTFRQYAGERYYISFGDDVQSKNFLYDGWVYLDSSAGEIANLEMDLNQVMANGQTAIFGFQCDGWTGTWDYTANSGSPERPNDVWIHSKAACNVRNWTPYQWHHVQIAYSRDDAGRVTYQTVWLDNVAQPINATVPSAFALGWSPVLLTNFQVDGRTTSGTSRVWLDDLTIYRW